MTEIQIRRACKKPKPRSSNQLGHFKAIECPDCGAPAYEGNKIQHVRVYEWVPLTSLAKLTAGKGEVEG